jgi:hypothetical protein
MRVALHATGDVGRRAGRILLAERRLVALGLYGHEGPPFADRKVMVIRDPTGYDVLATDDPEVASAMAGIAADDGLHCVVTARHVDEGLHERFVAAGRSLLVGADHALGLAASLASHEVARPAHIGATTVAWTAPGKPRRRGVPIPFPEPVGPRWGRKVEVEGFHPSVRTVEIPLAGTWAAATVTVTGSEGADRVRRVVGFADHADHLAGIALAAGVIAVAEGAYRPGACRPVDAAEAYLAGALRVGLGIAAYTA